MPDPNLPPLLLDDVRTTSTSPLHFLTVCTQSYITAIASAMPELPPALLRRLQVQYGISGRDAEVLVSLESGAEVGYDGAPGEGSVVRYFEAVAEGRDAKSAVNWYVAFLRLYDGS